MKLVLASKNAKKLVERILAATPVPTEDFER